MENFLINEISLGGNGLGDPPGQKKNPKVGLLSKKKPTYAPSSTMSLVQVPLMLRKPDERRQLTQRWRFTQDGRLMSAHNGLFVQAKDGFVGMHRGQSVSQSGDGGKLQIND